MTVEEAGGIILEDLLEVLGESDVDGVPDPEGGAIDISTDHWTLHLEGWPDGVAWLAIDSEPDNPASFEAARRAVLPLEVEWALAEADARLDGALARALIASGDPFSIDFARALEKSE